MKLFQQSKQNSIQPREHKALYILLSFLLPAVIILAALAGLKITPFGDKSLVISDGNALYINYLGYVARTVKGQENVLFSFEKGLGGNMMSSWGWFLLNPFFPLFAFFDITHYMTAYTLVSLLNFSLCGLTMYILLADLYGHKRSNLIFSTAYALNGFLVANVFQMNFFTGVPTLSLMVLGLRKILRNKNPLLYILSLAYSLLTNFYFGFMLCAASLLIFAAFYIADWERLENRKAVAVKYIVSSLLAGALSAFVWLPALLALRGGRLDQSVARAVSFRENMPFLEMASKLFTGANSTAELSNGLPNIFVGILPVALVILFFMNDKIDRRRKIASAVLLLAYLISFLIPTFNLIMHGGTTTNWFNYRDSFVFCFLLLMIAAEQWRQLDGTPKEHFKRAALLLLLGAIVVFAKQYEFVHSGEVLLDFLLLGLMYLAYRMYRNNPEKNPKPIMELIVLVLVCVNLYLNYEFCTKNILSWSNDKPEYQETVMPVSVLVDAAKASDPDLFRMEVTEQRSGNCGNDPMLYGYYGVGHGGSDDRNFVRNALSKLGVRRFDMRNSYGKGIPAATDTLLGIKYLISKDDLTEEKGYEKLVNIGEWSLYRNPNVLPIAMLAGDAVAEIETEYTDVFDNLNRAWAAISDQDIPLFTEENDIVFTSHNITDPITLKQAAAAELVASRDAAVSGGPSLSESESGEASDNKSNEFISEGILKEPPENTNYIEYTWTAKQDGPVYSYNRSGVADDHGAILPALNYEGYYHKGDIITSYLPVTDTLVTQYVLEDVAGRFRAAYADNDALHELAAIVKSRPCTIEKVQESHLRGEFTAVAGQKLMFTIPYDEGWTCFIDGQEAAITQVLGVFMAVDVPEGTHSYAMKFFPTGLRAGLLVFGLAIIGLIVFLLHDRKNRSGDTESGSPETEKLSEAPAEQAEQ